MASFSIALRNYSGVPVVELIGRIDRETLTMVEDILNKLVQAGHYNAMINLKRATWNNLDLYSSLAGIANSFRIHYGKLNVVAGIEQIQSLRTKSVKGNSATMRLLTSENQALGRIKGLPPPLMGETSSTTAKLA